MVHDAPWEGNNTTYHCVFQVGDRYRMFYVTGHLAPLLTMTVVMSSAHAEAWKAHEVRQLDEQAGGVRMPAKLQIVTENWNRVVAVPYIVYMPEKDRLLMLVSCD